MPAQTARKLNNSGFQTMHLHHVQNAPGWVHRLKSTDLNRLHCIHFGRATDPVCGSGHCHILSYWAKREQKEEFTAFQASRRGGVLYGKVNGNRILLGGEAALYSEAEIYAEQE